MEEVGDDLQTEGHIQVEELEADVASPPVALTRRMRLRRGMLSAFGYRDFRILFSGALLSNIGTWIHTAALLWFVKEMTGSDGWVGAVNFVSFIPVLFLVLFAGSLADWLDRKRLILATQAMMMLGALALAAVVTAGAARLWVIMVITGFMGVSFAFTFPAWRSIIPDLVSPEDMLNAIALDAASFNLARFAGPVIAGVVISAWSVSVAFYMNAASFTAVLLAVSMVRTKTPSQKPPPGGTGKHIREVLRYVRRNRWAGVLLAALGVSAFFGFPFIVLLPTMARDVLDRGATGYGLLLGFLGLGAVAGAPLVTLLGRRFKERDVIKAAMVVTGFVLMGFALSRFFWLSLLFSFCLGLGMLTIGATTNTILQSKVARDMRGRIMSLYILVLQGIFPVGGLAMGLLADETSAPLSLLIGGSVCLSGALVLLAFPALLNDAYSPGWSNPVDDGVPDR